MKILVTGGAGFIGSAVVRQMVEKHQIVVATVDKLTYAANLKSLASVRGSIRHKFYQLDINDSAFLKAVFEEFRPDRVMHLAAESHVDKSIEGPAEFIKTNILGTFNLLEIANDYFQKLSSERRRNFLFHHVSTDEVYGDLPPNAPAFTEESRYQPSSPYSASKASSDHLVRSWYRTFGLPVVITNCSNNYGPYQYPEKLIPLVIKNALAGKELPIFGDGKQVRDWLYVEDHATALIKVILEGNVGETYNIGGRNEITNLEVVHKICSLMEDRLSGLNNSKPAFKSLINFVEDRPGHDTRYAIDASKIADTLGWVPQESFESGLKKTVGWYLDNKNWFDVGAMGAILEGSDT